jgi:hypothetical protein
LKSRTGSCGRICSRVVGELFITVKAFAVAAISTNRYWIIMNESEASKSSNDSRQAFCCAHGLIVSSCSHANGESYVRCGLFLGSGRDISQRKRYLVHQRRVCGGNTAESDVSGCLYRQDRTRRGRRGGVRSITSQL